MTKYLLTLLCIACSNLLFATDFITRWDMSKPGSNPTELTFGVGTTGSVNYTWETVPAGTNGSGTFTGTTAIITGLPANAIIRLHIDTTNFNRINIYYGTDRQRLVDVEQWGSVAWSSMETAFRGCSNLNITSTDIPDLSNVTNMSAMFQQCTSLNGPANINSWNTSNVTNMEGMFSNANFFNQPIDNWDVSNVTNMSFMFYEATSFNQSIGNWNTGNVLNMFSMFRNASNFNQPVGNWNTGNVITMVHMFYNATNFNQPLDSWNTSNVTIMSSMFYNATNFNQPLDSWNTINVFDMNAMFRNASNFNQPIGSWNTDNVNYIAFMFYNATSFNQPIGNWNTSNVSDMSSIFEEATSFNQYLGNWNLNPNVNLSKMLTNSGLDCSNYSATLYGWANNPLTPSGRNLDASGRHYGVNVQSARDYLINTKGWTIIGDALNPGICYPTSTNDVIEDSKNISVYPNPTNTELHIQNSELKELQLYNSLGQLLFTTKNNILDVSTYAKGIYYLKCEHQVVKVVVE